MWPSLREVPCYAAVGRSALYANTFPFPAVLMSPGPETSIPSAAPLPTRLVLAVDPRRGGAYIMSHVVETDAST
jgi:hypothetical protein